MWQVDVLMDAVENTKRENGNIDWEKAFNTFIANNPDEKTRTRLAFQQKYKMVNKAGEERPASRAVWSEEMVNYHSIV